MTDSTDKIVALVGEMDGLPNNVDMMLLGERFIRAIQDESCGNLILVAEMQAHACTEPETLGML